VSRVLNSKRLADERFEANWADTAALDLTLVRRPLMGFFRKRQKMALFGANRRIGCALGGNAAANNRVVQYIVERA